MKKIGVIDLGSNSLRMSIYEASTPYKIINSYRDTVRLSEGMSKTMLLSDEAQIRTANKLAEYKSLLDGQGVDEIYAVATAAVRKAKNSQQFLAFAKAVSGINIKVIDGKTEAALDSLAVTRTLDCKTGLICDIGGGSTELIGICDGDVPVVSIPHGSRAICEKFLLNGETPADIHQARFFVNKLLAKEVWLKNFKGSTLVGIGGTLRALAKLDLNDISPAPIENHRLSPQRLNELFDLIAASDIPKRTKMAGIGKDRADIIMGGIIILKAVLEVLAPQKIVVADVGVREGVFLDKTEGHGILR